MSKLEDWEKDAVDVSHKYQASPMAPSVEMGGDFKETVSETIPDVAAQALQSASLEWADNAIETVSPETAQDFREFLATAKRRSPMATTMAEIMTPDLLDVATLGANKVFKIKKAMGALGKIAGGRGPVKDAVMTDVISQTGEEGEYDPSRTAMAGSLGLAAKGVQSLAPSAAKLRQAYMGVKPKDVARRTEAFDAQEYLDSIVNKADEKGLFKSGQVIYNPRTLAWERLGEGQLKFSNAKSKVKGSVVPPSQREVLKRMEEAKKSIADETQELIEGWSGQPRDFAQTEMFTVASQTPGVFAKRSFNNDIEDILDGIHFDSDKQRDKMRTKLNEKLSTVFGAEDTAEASLVQLHDLRKNLDARINYDRKRAQAKNPFKEQAFKGLSDVIRERVAESVAGSGRLELLNKAYMNLSDLSGPLTNKVLDPSGLKGDRGLFLGNIGSKAVSAMEMISDKAAGVGSQTMRTLDKAPDLGVGARALRKLTPAMSPEQEPSREPQSMFNPIPLQEQMDMNLPKQLQKTKMPRTTEGVLENKQLFKLKVAQEAENFVVDRAMKTGLDPQMLDPEMLKQEATDLYKNVADTLEDFPEEVGAVLPIWIKDWPHFFEKDPYSRIDGVVGQSARPQLREDIRKNPNLTNTQRIEKLDLLNRTGRYEDQEMA